jgi:hypothetical protein
MLVAATRRALELPGWPTRPPNHSRTDHRASERIGQLDSRFRTGVAPGSTIQGCLLESAAPARRAADRKSLPTFRRAVRASEIARQATILRQMDESAYRTMASPSGLIIALSKVADMVTGDYRDQLFAYVAEADLGLEPTPPRAVVELAAGLPSGRRSSASAFGSDSFGMRSRRPRARSSSRPRSTAQRSSSRRVVASSQRTRGA